MKLRGHGNAVRELKKRIKRSLKNGASKGFTQHHFSTKSGAGFTIVELLVVVAVMALLTAALSPLFRTSYQAWRLGDRRAEVIQNARIGMDKMSWELKQIKMVSDVSSPTNPQGYITFLDYEENLKEFRYEVGYLTYVSGTVATLAGPIESLYFSCYESNGSTLTTSLTNISFIVAQMVTSDEEGEVDSLTSTNRIYLRRDKGWVQVNWSGGTTTPILEAVTTTTTKYYQGTNVDHTTAGQVTLYEDPPGNYNSPGTLESSVYDTGASDTDYGIMSWDASTPINTDVKFQIRTGISISDLSSKSFVGPDGMTDTYYTTSGTDIWSGHDGDQYIQYKSVLTTTDSLITPTLYEVIIELE